MTASWKDEAKPVGFVRPNAHGGLPRPARVMVAEQYDRQRQALNEATNQKRSDD